MERIKRWLNYMGGHQILDTIPVGGWRARRAVYTEPVRYEYEERELVIEQGDHLIVSGQTIFLEQTVEVPEAWGDGPAGLVFRAGAKGHTSLQEGLVRLDGLPYHGLDRNRSYVSLPHARLGKRSFAVHIELYNPIAQVEDRLNHQNEPAEYDPVPLTLLQSELVLTNPAVQSLMHTVKVYLDAALLLAEGDLNRLQIMKALRHTCEQVGSDQPERLRDQEWVASQEAALREELAAVEGYTQGKMHMVGQSHIDLAWLWPLKESVRKCSRTFSTMSTLLDEYPSFTYAQSQPQAYAFVKEHYPELYERVKKHIADGRWELVGGMWVEPDLNIPSGESLVRQLLYGMKFYKEEFGQQPRIEWLPDTFGYCASLPQLLRKAGLDTFMTTKMNWNDTNPFPYDLFHWVGIDGTRILSYLNHGVNEYTHPNEIKVHWDSFKGKAVHPEQMLLYGHGDGGGGVTREMIEYVERSADLPGLPSSTFSTAAAFVEGLHEAKPDLPEWHGDMYLELHRGTYTTHARNKRWNRKAEVLYRDAEIWGSVAAWTIGDKAPSLEEDWKLLLLNQFHDIIPGSSIPEVYTQSTLDYEKVFAVGEAAKSETINALAAQISTEGEGIPVIVFNSLSWTRSECVTLVGDASWSNLGAYDEQGQVLKSDLVTRPDGQVELLVQVEAIPQMGYRTVWLRPRPLERAEANQSPAYDGAWETKLYSIVWNERGEITRLYDKRAQREVLREGERANQLQLFHDRPLSWDAWDVDPQFASQPADQPKLIEADVVQQGEVQDVIRFRWQLSSSTIEQDLVLYHDHARIDFRTRVDWQEAHKLLKVAFPVDVLSSKASYEIPFGTVERATHTNTSWEQAQFEVCGHRWADLSEAGYGVSLLNDSKYGYDVKGNVLRLSLLRAPKWPDAGADLGLQEFTYSLFPHQDDWRQAGTVRRGYELNHPVTAYISEAHPGTLPASHSFIELDSQHTVLDTVKPAEEGDGYVLRMYEAAGGRERVGIEVSAEITSVSETNLLEEVQGSLDLEQGLVRTATAPYEVKTLLIHL